MTIAPIINCLHPELDSRQRQVIGHTEGPMLFIAGPGAGKTRSMQLRAVNLLLTGQSAARGMLLCTFGRDAASKLHGILVEHCRDASLQSGQSTKR